MEIVLYLSLAAIMLLGVPHGAFDPIIADRLGWLSNSSRLVMFYLGYLLVTVLVFFIWPVFPMMSLFGFLLVSVYHFSQDFKVRSVLGRLSYGTLILTIPVVLHSLRVEELFDHLLFGQSSKPLIAIMMFACAISFLVLLFSFKSYSKKQLIELAGIVSMGLLLDPLVYFALFFCLLHSPRHIKHEWNLLPIHKQKMSLVIGAGVIFATYILAVIAANYLNLSLSDVSGFFTIVFIGLAALTYPHMFLVEIARYKRAYG
jgi:Brp/Blh family beta-carotene 15,15'-monooxygenase